MFKLLSYKNMLYITPDVSEKVFSSRTLDSRDWESDLQKLNTHTHTHAISPPPANITLCANALMNNYAFAIIKRVTVTNTRRKSIGFAGRTSKPPQKLGFTRGGVSSESTHTWRHTLYTTESKRKPCRH